MWEIYEHHSVATQLSSDPVDVLKKHKKWNDIVSLSGAQGLRKLKGKCESVHM